MRSGYGRGRETALLGTAFRKGDKSHTGPAITKEGA